MITQAQQQKIEKAVEACLAKANEIYDIKFDSSDVTQRFNITSARTMGQAKWRRSSYTGKVSDLVLRWHPEAISQNVEHYADVIVPHEVAHIVCAMNPSLGKNHDRGWQRVAEALGCANPRATDSFHMYNLTKAKSSKPMYTYKDALGETYEMSAQRHARLQKGSTYRSKATGSLISKAGYVGSNAPTQATPVTVPKQRTAPKQTSTAGSKSNAQLVREYISANYVTEALADACKDSIINWALHMFKNRGAASSCVKANIPKVFK